jgi:hypothetical protein
VTTALAYVSWGRFVADCPTGDCLDAVAVYPPGSSTPDLDQTCYFGHPITVDMPADADDIMTVLAERINDADKTWYPAGHARAVAQGLPHGLTLAELADEGDVLNARWAE